MTVDQSIVQQVWNGSIPCIFTLHRQQQQEDNANGNLNDHRDTSSQSIVSHDTNDLRLMVSRQSYLPSLNHIVLDHFNNHPNHHTIQHHTNTHTHTHSSIIY